MASYQSNDFVKAFGEDFGSICQIYEARRSVGEVIRQACEHDTMT